jgi:Mitochondrial carrier protein
MASGLAAAVVKTILQPFDTIKTVQQAGQLKLGPIGATLKVIERSGVKGLWSGIGITGEHHSNIVCDPHPLTPICLIDFAFLYVICARLIRGLFMVFVVLGSSPSVAVYFGVYSSLKKHLTPLFPPSCRLIAVALSAAIGNTFASVLRVPYEVGATAVVKLATFDLPTLGAQLQAFSYFTIFVLCSATWLDVRCSGN